MTYDPDASAPTWDRFLARVLPDAEVRAWVQRFVGYSLTGDVREQVLMFAYGSGANGKSVLLDVLLGIVGDYAHRSDPELLLAKQGETHQTGTADLEGRRLVVASEIEHNRAWSEATIKRITGDSTITARKMRMDFYTFPATHKLWIAANTKPKVHGNDHGIWRRMRLVPFEVTIPAEEQDRGLVTKLLATEAAGILAWAVRGCLAWQAEGLGEPATIANATAGYRADQDVLGHWIEDECVVLDGVWASTSELYDSYRGWCERTGRHAMSRDVLRERLLERPGISEHRKSGARGMRGIMVKSDRVMIGMGGNMTHDGRMTGDAR